MTKAWKRVGGAVGVAGALIVGGIVAGTVSASADEGSTASTGSSTSRPVGDGERGPRGEELTGDTASQVEAAVLAAYPGAELVHSMAGPDGGYAAAITTAEDARLLVLLDDSFTVTGTETPPAGRGGGPGGPGGFGEELTGDTATQVEAAVLAAYPDAQIMHSMAGPDGGYAAAITTAEDARLLVLLDDSFTVTGTQTPPAGRGGGPGGPGGFGEELTGDTATQVEAAVLAAYPGAEIVHSMAGPDGGYAAAITTAEDARLLVLLDDSFTVTDTLSPPAGRGGSGGGQPEDD